MSATQASFYWRRAGLSFLKMANVAGECVRNSLKEPVRSQAKLRETIYYRASTWKDGKPEKTVITDITEHLKGLQAKK